LPFLRTSVTQVRSQLLKPSFFLLFTLLVGLTKASATTITGRFTTALYSYERALQSGAESTALRAYQTGRIKIAGIGSKPGLSVQTYGRISNDLADDRDREPIYRVYHVYFRYQDTQDRFDIRFGRQTVFSGVGIGRIDGIRVTGRVAGRARVDVYGGSLVSGGNEGLRSPMHAGMVGGHVVLSDLAGATLGLSAFRRSRTVAPYSSGAREQAGLQQAEIAPGEVEQQMLGLDAAREFGRTSARLRWAVSTLDGWGTRRFEADLRHRHAGWTVSAGYLYRTPYLDANSIFSVFSSSPNHELTFRLNKRLNRHLGFFGEVSRVSFEDASTTRLHAGVNVLNGYLGYVRRTGFAGSSDGLSGVLRYRLSPTVSASASVGLTRYTTFSGASAHNRVLANSLGINWRPLRALTASVQGQRLSQDLQSTTADPFTGARHDHRVFLSASTWFFKMGQTE